MATNENALALTGDPGQLHDQIDAVARDIHHRLDVAWTALNADGGGVDEANNQLVAIDEEMRQLQQFGEVSLAYLAGMQEAIQVVTEQRDRAIADFSDAQEQIDDLRAGFDEAISQAVQEEMMYGDPEDFFDMDELAQEAQDNFVVDVEIKIRHLRNEGFEADAAEMEDQLAAFMDAQQAITEGSAAAQGKLVEASNARLVAQGREPSAFYFPIRSAITPADALDDEEDTEDLELDSEDEDDAA